MCSGPSPRGMAWVALLGTLPGQAYLLVKGHSLTGCYLAGPTRAPFKRGWGPGGGGGSSPPPSGGAEFLEAPKKRQRKIFDRPKARRKFGPNLFRGGGWWVAGWLGPKGGGG